MRRSNLLPMRAVMETRDVAHAAVDTLSCGHVITYPRGDLALGARYVHKRRRCPECGPKRAASPL
jgi:hypothetical protein